jgi:hypothetical protein
LANEKLHLAYVGLDWLSIQWFWYDWLTFHEVAGRRSYAHAHAQTEKGAGLLRQRDDERLDEFLKEILVLVPNVEGSWGFFVSSYSIPVIQNGKLSCLDLELRNHGFCLL